MKEKEDIDYIAYIDQLISHLDVNIKDLRSKLLDCQTQRKILREIKKKLVK